MWDMINYICKGLGRVKYFFWEGNNRNNNNENSKILIIFRLKLIGLFGLKLLLTMDF